MKNIFMLALAFGYFLLAVHGSEHLCPPERACPLSTSPVSYVSTGICNDNSADAVRAGIRSTLTVQLGSYQTSDNEYFDRIKPKYLGQNKIYSADSCAEIKATFPASPSGWYWVSERRIYCNFDLQTPASAQNWERLLWFDMKNPDTNCPSVFRVSEPPETMGRFCVRPSTNNGQCTSLFLPPATSEITEIYGRIYGIQIGTADITNSSVGRNIDEAYLDGVSVTIGSPREHVWSFMAYTSESEAGCPCSAGSTNTPPSFVGNNYFCESGTFLSGNDFAGDAVFHDDPLWDGQQCNGLEASCCVGQLSGSGQGSPPWFYKALSAPVSGTNLELRICADQGFHDENMGLQLVELYVQ